MILGPAIDGGYTLIGLSRAAPELFQDIAWSSSDVLAATLKRAKQRRLSVARVACNLFRACKTN